MKIVRQLAVFLENQPGALLRVTKDLAKNGIDIQAISVSDSMDHAVVRMVVDKPTEALHMLGDAGAMVVETEVLQLNLANKPGALTGICEALEKIGMNIEYAYGSTPSEQSTGLLYIRVMNAQKVIDALQDQDL